MRKHIYGAAYFLPGQVINMRLKLENFLLPAFPLGSVPIFIKKHHFHTGIGACSEAGAFCPAGHGAQAQICLRKQRGPESSTRSTHTGFLPDERHRPAAEDLRRTLFNAFSGKAPWQKPGQTAVLSKFSCPEGNAKEDSHCFGRQ